MQKVLNNIVEYNSRKEGKVLIAFDDMIAGILFFISFLLGVRNFQALKDARINTTYFFTMKIQ